MRSYEFSSDCTSDSNMYPQDSGRCRNICFESKRRVDRVAEHLHQVEACVNTIRDVKVSELVVSNTNSELSVKLDQLGRKIDGLCRSTEAIIAQDITSRNPFTTREVTSLDTKMERQKAMHEQDVAKLEDAKRFAEIQLQDHLDGCADANTNLKCEVETAIQANFGSEETKSAVEKAGEKTSATGNQIKVAQLQQQLEIKTLEHQSEVEKLKVLNDDIATQLAAAQRTKDTSSGITDSTDPEFARLKVEFKELQAKHGSLKKDMLASNGRCSELEGKIKDMEEDAKQTSEDTRLAHRQAIARVFAKPKLETEARKAAEKKFSAATERVDEFPRWVHENPKLENTETLQQDLAQAHQAAAYWYAAVNGDGTEENFSLTLQFERKILEPDELQNVIIQKEIDAMAEEQSFLPDEMESEEVPSPNAEPETANDELTSIVTAPTSPAGTGIESDQDVTVPKAVMAESSNTKSGDYITASDEVETLNELVSEPNSRSWADGSTQKPTATKDTSIPTTDLFLSSDDAGYIEEAKGVINAICKQCSKKLELPFEKDALEDMELHWSKHDKICGKTETERTSTRSDPSAKPTVDLEPGNQTPAEPDVKLSVGVKNVAQHHNVNAASKTTPRKSNGGMMSSRFPNESDQEVVNAPAKAFAKTSTLRANEKASRNNPASDLGTFTRKLTTAPKKSRRPGGGDGKGNKRGDGGRYNAKYPRQLTTSGRSPPPNLETRLLTATTISCTRRKPSGTAKNLSLSRESPDPDPTSPDYLNRHIHNHTWHGARQRASRAYPSLRFSGPLLPTHPQPSRPHVHQSAPSPHYRPPHRLLLPHPCAPRRRGAEDKFISKRIEQRLAPLEHIPKKIGELESKLDGRLEGVNGAAKDSKQDFTDATTTGLAHAITDTLKPVMENLLDVSTTTNKDIELINGKVKDQNTKIEDAIRVAEETSQKVDALTTIDNKPPVDDANTSTILNAVAKLSEDILAVRQKVEGIENKSNDVAPTSDTLTASKLAELDSKLDAMVTNNSNESAILQAIDRLKKNVATANQELVSLKSKNDTPDVDTVTVSKLAELDSKLGAIVTKIDNMDRELPKSKSDELITKNANESATLGAIGRLEQSVATTNQELVALKSKNDTPDVDTLTTAKLAELDRKLDQLAGVSDSLDAINQELVTFKSKNRDLTVANSTISRHTDSSGDLETKVANLMDAILQIKEQVDVASQPAFTLSDETTGAPGSLTSFSLAEYTQQLAGVKNQLEPLGQSMTNLKEDDIEAVVEKVWVVLQRQSETLAAGQETTPLVSAAAELTFSTIVAHNNAPVAPKTPEDGRSYSAISSQVSEPVAPAVAQLSVSDFATQTTEPEVPQPDPLAISDIITIQQDAPVTQGATSAEATKTIAGLQTVVDNLQDTLNAKDQSVSAVMSALEGFRIEKHGATLNGAAILEVWWKKEDFHGEDLETIMAPFNYVNASFLRLAKEHDQTIVERMSLKSRVTATQTQKDAAEQASTALRAKVDELEGDLTTTQKQLADCRDAVKDPEADYASLNEEFDNAEVQREAEEALVAETKERRQVAQAELAALVADKDQPNENSSEDLADEVLVKEIQKHDTIVDAVEADEVPAQGYIMPAEPPTEVEDPELKEFDDDDLRTPPRPGFNATAPVFVPQPYPPAPAPEVEMDVNVDSQEGGNIASLIPSVADEMQQSVPATADEQRTEAAPIIPVADQISETAPADGEQPTGTPIMLLVLKGGMKDSVHARANQKATSTSKTDSTAVPSFTIPGCTQKVAWLKEQIENAAAQDRVVEKRCGICELRAQIDIVDGKEDWNKHEREQHVHAACGVMVFKHDLDFHTERCSMSTCKAIEKSRREGKKEQTSAVPSEKKLKLRCYVCKEHVLVVDRDNPTTGRQKLLWTSHNQDYHTKCEDCSLDISTATFGDHKNNKCAKRKGPIPQQIVPKLPLPIAATPGGRQERAAQLEPVDTTDLEMCPHCADWLSIQPDRKAFDTHCAACKDQITICGMKGCGDVMGNIYFHVNHRLWCKARKIQQRWDYSANNPDSIAWPAEDVPEDEDTATPTHATTGLGFSIHNTNTTTGAPHTPTTTNKSDPRSPALTGSPTNTSGRNSSKSTTTVGAPHTPATTKKPNTRSPAPTETPTNTLTVQDSSRTPATAPVGLYRSYMNTQPTGSNNRGNGPRNAAGSWSNNRRGENRRHETRRPDMSRFGARGARPAPPPAAQSQQPQQQWGGNALQYQNKDCKMPGTEKKKE
ncbi:hypothetical protein CC86DRAFT_464759 [Ophiobolus disseminans]|uniref:Uncharacterized protein n=1 Tax=Ophiobolus disseminans TaxID=1469910 RepID=A0A6A7A6Z5_9PLEO|nr:hypothetical protein CC86DRAFT_464759 [Ophiobolus disseminans]